MFIKRQILKWKVGICVSKMLNNEEKIDNIKVIKSAKKQIAARYEIVRFFEENNIKFNENHNFVVNTLNKLKNDIIGENDDKRK